MTTTDSPIVRPIDSEIIPIGTRRHRRIRDAVSVAESMLADRERDSAFSLEECVDLLRGAEGQILAADGVVDPDLIARCMRVADKLGVASRVVPTVQGAAPVVVAPTAPTAITTSNIVVGARVAGSGTLTSWRGSGELTRGRIVEILASARLPGDWAPKSRTSHAQLGRIVLGLRGGDRKTGAVKKSTTDTWAARWWVDAGQSADVAVGASASRRVLVVTLTEADTVEIVGDADLAAQVRAEYDRRIAAEVYTGNDVTRWLAGLLADRFGAVALGINWYVKADHVTAAEALTAAVQNAGWGEYWMNAIPVATTEQLRKGLAAGLIAEARTVLDDLAIQRGKARDAGRPDVGSRVAVGLLADLRRVAERAQAVGAVLGADAIGNVRATVLAAIAVLEPLCDDTDARGALIWAELNAEAV